MFPTKEIVYRYIQACQVQECYELKLAQTLQLLCPDNQLMSLSDPIRKPYRDLVEDLVGKTAFDWVEWWQYETDYGKDARDFKISDQEYTTDDMTTIKFLDIILDENQWTS